DAVAVFVEELAGGPGGDRGVVGGGVRIGLGGQALAGLQLEAACGCGLDDLRVEGRIDHDRHCGVVLRGGADHGRASDVDLLDNLVLRRAGGDGLHERVQVHHDQV